VIESAGGFLKIGSAADTALVGKKNSHMECA
jgi:hypothetical protein